MPLFSVLPGSEGFFIYSHGFKTAARQLINLFGFGTGLSSNNLFRRCAEPFERSVQCKKRIFG